MNAARSFLRKALEKRPLAANSLIYGSLCVTAEFFQQTVSKKITSSKPEKYDFDVLGRYAIYGTFLAGPMLATWYRLLDRKLIGKTAGVVAKKVAVDQFFFTPQLLAVFYVSMSLMEGETDVLDELKSKFAQTFGTSCAFWLPVQAVNFTLVPPIFRVTYVGACSFAWVNALCYIKRQNKDDLS